ncbi:MAG: FAD-dependent oxidoreductase [Candidatus Zambryskibacteria bacterium]|nr:FAD-dependent oxidoreductase [Candidatus Zambryskibacteria bacterium]
MFDLIIIGGGPAGAAAGVYAARKRLKTILITESFGGQSTVSVNIENWIGTKSISGADLGRAFEEHLRSSAGDSVEIKTGDKVTNVVQSDGALKVTAGNDSYTARTVLITTGSARRKLEIPGAKEFENKGIVYCASCDGPLFAGQDVAVIGGGNAAFETAAQLLAYTKSVTLLVRSDKFKADEVTVQKVLSHPNMKVVKNAVPKEIKGRPLDKLGASKFVSSLVYEAEGVEKEIPVTGIFVEIGLIPTTDFIKELISLNKYGQIPIDPKTQRTKIDGIWAAGDSTDGLYHQNNIAAGDAVKALEDIYLYLHAK